MLLPSSNQSIPIRTEIAEVYGGYFIRKGHAVFTIISSTREREYNWKGLQIHEVPSKKRLRKLRLAQKVIEEKNCNLIQVRNGPIDGIFGLYLKWKYKIPLIFHYTWPALKSWEEKVKLKRDKRLHLKGLVEKFTDFLQMRIMHGADLVLPVGKWMKAYLVSRGVPKKKMLSFPDGVNPKVFSPENSGTEKRREHGLGSSPVITYVGTMDTLRQLDFLIRTFRKVKGRVKNVKLLMVGDGDDREYLERFATDLRVCKDIVFTGKVPYPEVPSFLAASDVTVSPIPPSALYKVSSPLKIFEYMGAGRSVVANEEIPEHKEVIQESGGGLLIPYDEENFANAIVELLNDPNKRERMSRNGRKWVLENRSYEKLAKKLEKAYFDLLKRRGRQFYV